MTFVETKLFRKLVQEYLTEDEYAVLPQALIVNPEAGDVIPASGGVRAEASVGSTSWAYATRRSGY